MLDGKGHVVMPDYVQVYYKRAVHECGRMQPEHLRQHSERREVHPGFRHGEWPRRAASRGFRVRKRDHGEPGQRRTNCRAGQKLEMRIQSLKCWNGQLDSADHRSHFATMISDASTNWVKKCPSSHPYLVPQFTISSFYTIGSGDDVGTLVAFLGLDVSEPAEGLDHALRLLRSMGRLVERHVGRQLRWQIAQLFRRGSRQRQATQGSGAAEVRLVESTRLVPIAARAAP